MDKKTFTEKFNEHASTCYGIDQGNKKYIYGRVAIGGSSGGNCWGGTSTPYRTGREASEAEVPTLDELIAELAPDISFIKYKVLVNSIQWQTTEYCSSDYYGNYRDYGYKYIDCNSLYEALESAGSLK